MKQTFNFQSIIMSLQDYWSRQGCLIWQPYYSQVGAGTMNPATSLRVLGPEPWNVAYVEPSIRPDDGRYGENPNRLQMHYQFQVILKPDPGNPQDLYLQSLEALGIDSRQHDIRFVEDNWESPALGAWGLGWEVWLDGQEITQFTYFQQAGGQVLDPVSVELTYGLERIAIALQRVSNFQDIQWSLTRTDGDVNLQAEQEHSKYYFEIADVERLRQMYDLFEKEAKACLEQKLVLPAHDYILKCSHTFNVLDTRGAIGVTERQAYFGRMRDLSRQVAEAYFEQRQQLEFPWLEGKNKHDNLNLPSLQTTPTHPAAPAPTTHSVQSRNRFLLEIGTEELPVADMNSAIEQLRNRMPALLEELRLEHGKVQVIGTPRRMVVIVEDMAVRQSDYEQVVKGPPASRAFAPDGTPTPAAEGFARGKGLTITDLQVREIDGGQYVAAVVHHEGRPAAQALTEALPGLLGAIRFDKSMRWNQSNAAFSRPLRWLLALYADQPLTFEYAGISSDSMTRGLRFNEPQEIQVNSSEEYFQQMERQGIILDPARRKKSIQDQIDVLAQQVGGKVIADPYLLDEVTNLVEAPTGLRGSFDPAHLQLPREVLISAMKKHQRYFPIERDGALLPYFITIANKPVDANGACEGADVIVEGNEHVIRARFADAAFFVRDDLKSSLEAFVPKLSTLTFQVKLGSMLDKTNRLVKLVEEVGPSCGLNTDDMEITRRAVQLCKADLATKMVVEMTSLQGTMGKHYALQSGESPAVAQAILEHYLPRYAGDQAPASKPGLALGIADRLDTLAGLFAAGLAPTGNKDPFAQRRAALGLVQNLITWKLEVDLAPGLHAAAANLPIASSEENLHACLTFIVERLRNLLLEQGYRYDVIDAILTTQGSNPARAELAVKDLTKWVSRADWNTILPAFSRCVRITRDLEQHFTVVPGGFVENIEREMLAALVQAETSIHRSGSVDDFLNAFFPLIPVINIFFDTVLVMAEDSLQRSNRLGLLQRISSLASGVADLSRLEGF